MGKLAKFQRCPATVMEPPGSSHGYKLSPNHRLMTTTSQNGTPSAPRRAWHPLPNFFRDLAESSPGAVLLETAKFDDQNFRTFLFHDPICELVADASDR